MHREPLLALLADYRRQYVHEGDVVGLFETFVRGHPDCFERSCLPGHITGSAWVANPAGNAVLLTHHRKLDLWIQLGGHSDGDADSMAVALREAQEESGLAVRPHTTAIFDIDRHVIPARRDDPEHYHYDVRYWLNAESLQFTVSEESHDLRWVNGQELKRLTVEPSMLRMLEKWRRLRASS
jgi:8-oxo-dGTP pyrophosphatase MutT (NUDIX family)